MQCTVPEGQRLLEEMVGLGCFPKSGKFFDPTGCSGEELEVLSQLQQQGFVAKIAGPNAQAFRFQFSSRGATLVQADWVEYGRTRT